MRAMFLIVVRKKKIDVKLVLSSYFTVQTRACLDGLECFCCLLHELGSGSR